MHPIDMTGQLLGALRVLGKAARPPDVKGYEKTSWWLCLCTSCGRQCVKPRCYLINSGMPNCGCRSSELHREALRKGLEAQRAKRAAQRTHDAEAALNIVSYTRARVCPQCANPFETLMDEWGYRRDGLYLCSWHCLRAYDSAKGKKRPYKRP